MGQRKEVEPLSGEQLDDVRGAHCLLVAGPNLAFLDRRPFRTKAVRVGRMVGAVVRVPVAAVDTQQVGPRLTLHDRHLDFHVAFRDGVLTAQPLGRATRAALGENGDVNVAGIRGIKGHIVGEINRDCSACSKAPSAAIAVASRISAAPASAI